MACNWLMVTSFGDNNWLSGPGVWVYSPTKLKKKINRRQSKKPPSLQLHGLITNFDDMGTLNISFPYSWFSCDVIIFQN